VTDRSVVLGMSGGIHSAITPAARHSLRNQVHSIGVSANRAEVDRTLCLPLDPAGRPLDARQKLSTVLSARSTNRNEPR